MKIFTYWEGSKPEYIKLCEKSLILHCWKDFEIIFLDEKQDLFKLTPEIRQLPINLKVDWLKANLVYKYGGFWIDADMIVTQNLKPLADYLETFKFIGIPGFFGGTPKAPILKRWVSGMKKIIDTGYELSFSDLIMPLIKDKSFKEFHPLTKKKICPIYHTGDEFWKLFNKEESVIKYVNKNNYIVTLYNSQFDKDFKKLSQEEIFSKNWLVSKMFKKALLQ